MSIEDECICSVQCEGSGSCACLYGRDENTCTCVCGPLQVLPAQRPKTVDSMVDICVKNAELSMVAEFLSRVCEAELFIPAARATTKISLRVKKASLGSVIEQLGLRIGLPG